MGIFNISNTAPSPITRPAPKGWAPGIEYSNGRPDVITTPAIPEVSNPEEYSKALESFGWTLPEGARLELVSATFDPAAWTRDESFYEDQDGNKRKTPAVTKPCWRYRLKVVYDSRIAIGDDKALEDWILNAPLPRPLEEITKGLGFVVCLADFQFGKTDQFGGTGDLESRILRQISSITDEISRIKPEHVLIADLGDCLAPDTEIVTKQGIRRIGDLAGQTVEVKDANGKWVETTIKSYGVKPTAKIAWKARGASKEVVASLGHEWILTDGERVSTEDLEPGMEAIRQEGGPSWIVDSVVPGEEMETFCCEVPTTHSFHLADGLLTSNCIENFSNVSTQRQTNDLDLTEQIRAWRRTLARFVIEIANVSPNVIAAVVPSNHGRVRIGPKEPASGPWDDFGIDAMCSVQDILESHGEKYGHVKFAYPSRHLDSLTIPIAGTNIGMAHGHQVNNPDKIVDYVSKQIAGRQPLESADFILTGHFHHFLMRQGIGGRWFIQAPTNDNGSSWFTTVSGEVSDPGILAFSVKDRAWGDLRIHS